MICKNFILFIFLLIVLSCSNKETVEEKPQGVQTPEVLNNESKFDLSSYGKRLGSDIIQQLFDEAIEKDTIIEAIYSRLADVREMRTDSQKAHEIYMRNNENYWNALKRYSLALQDSTMKIEVNKLIERLKKRQAERTSDLYKLMADIDSTEWHLNDLEILMKIVVTEPMMNNYQRNELPDLRPIEAFKSAMDSSVKEIKTYTKIPE